MCSQRVNLVVILGRGGDTVFCSWVVEWFRFRFRTMRSILHHSLKTFFISSSPPVTPYIPLAHSFGLLYSVVMPNHLALALRMLWDFSDADNAERCVLLSLPLQPSGWHGACGMIQRALNLRARFLMRWLPLCDSTVSLHSSPVPLTDWFLF